MEFPFKTIDIQSYDDKNRQGKIKVFDKPDLENEGEGWVFIDEVCDTGQTVEYLRELYPKAVFTALCAKDKGREVIDLYISAHPQNEWIVYPWEVAEK